MKHDLKHMILSDPDHKVIGRYDAWGGKPAFGRTVEGVIRSTWLVTPEGKLAFHWPKVKAAGHAGEVRRKLEELKGKGRRAA